MLTGHIKFLFERTSKGIFDPIPDDKNKGEANSYQKEVPHGYMPDIKKGQIGIVSFHNALYDECLKLNCSV